MARGIPSSPRRSHRGGHSKSKKEKVDEVDEDDGGTTRCVCNQQHHEGVMIQCETCKVWQHCPCVGLGNGEVTPDKYYCDSCRPENHPYRVQDGQPISNSKRAQQVPPSPTPAGSKAKSSKKRSTSNSKDTSNFVDLASSHHNNKNHNKDDDEWVDAAAASTKRNNHDEDDLNVDATHSNNHTRTSKRRKRVSNPSEDIDVATTNNKHLKRGANGKQRSNDSSPEDTDKEADMQPASPPTSPKSSIKSIKSSKGSKAKKPSSSTNTYHNKTPVYPSLDTHDAKDEEPSHHNDDQDEESSPTHSLRQPQTGRRANGKKNSRPLEEDTMITERSTALSNKKKKTKSEQQQEQQEVAMQDDDHHDQDVDQFPSIESSEDSLEATSSSTAAQSNSYDNDKLMNERLSSPSPSTSKKTSFRRVAMQRVSSDSPTPSGTPQPMPPAPPCKVRYPSAKMPLKDMVKRAQQLLEYIGRAQVEMVDLKNKREESITPMPTDTFTRTITGASTATSSSPSSTTQVGSRSKYQLQITVDTEMRVLSRNIKTGSADLTDAHWLSTPPQSVHELSHGDTTEQSMMACHLKQVQADRHRASIEEAPTPLCLDSEPGKGKVPMTPPHQSHGQDDNGMELTKKDGDASDTKSHDGPGTEPGQDSFLEASCRQATCQDLMDKLTRDLINFQDKFGRTVD